MTARPDWIVVHPAVPWRDGQTTVTEAATRLIAQNSTCAVKPVRLHVRRPWITLADLAGAAVAVVLCRRGLYLSARSGRGWPLDIPLLLIARLVPHTRILVHLHSSAAARRPSRTRVVFMRLVDIERCTMIALCGAYADHISVAYRLRSASTVVVGNEAFVEEPGSEPVRRETRTSPNQARRPITLGFFSNLSADKGVLDALDTFAQLHERGIADRLLIGGPLPHDAEARRIVDRVAAIGYSELLGALSSNERDEFFAAIDWLIFPSTYVHEYSPMVLMEALARGVPVVAASIGCVPSAIRAPSAVLDTPFGSPSTIGTITSLIRPIEEHERSDIRESFRAERRRHTETFVHLIR